MNDPVTEHVYYMSYMSAHIMGMIIDENKGQKVE